MTTKVPNSMLQTPGGEAPAVVPKACFRAYHSAQQSVPVGVWTKMQFNTPLINEGSHYVGATSRFTPPAGYCQLSASCELLGTGLEAGSILRLGVYRNGALYIMGPSHRVSAANTNLGIDVAGLALADGDDFFELFALYSMASGGATATFSLVAQETRFEGFQI